MVAGGAIAGFVGAHLVARRERSASSTATWSATGFAWTGLLVTLLARHRPGPILVAGVFFAALQSRRAGHAAQRRGPWQLAQVLQAVVIIVLVSRFAFGVRPATAPMETTSRTHASCCRDDDSVTVGEL